MIKIYTLKALQAAMNHGLSLDETRRAKIESLHGKVLEIVVNPLRVNFFIGFSNGGLELYPEYQDEVDTIIESNPLGLIRLSLLPASKVRSLFNDEIKVSGDITLGQNVKQLFDELDIDWEGHLAQFTGDVVAYQIGSLFRNGKSAKAQVSNSLKQSLTEYLQEELHCFPPREEVEDFFKDVDYLSLNVERLDAQMKLLMADHETD